MGEDFGEQVGEMVAGRVEGTGRSSLEGVQYAEGWDLDSRFIGLKQVFTPTLAKDALDVEDGTVDEVVELAVEDALEQYDERERLIGEEQMRTVERAVMLQVIDGRWKEHLLDMDYLQEGIHLRALGQRDPLVEYKGEGFDLFNDMLEGIKTSTVTTLMKNRPEDLAMFTAITLDEPVVALNYTSGDDLINQTSFTGAAMAAGEYGGPDGEALADAPLPNVAAGGGRGATTSTAPVQVQQRVVFDKVGRNDPCPCGSGKKYKKCHGA
jgi:preprotein translocase subunit SecA